MTLALAGAPARADTLAMLDQAAPIPASRLPTLSDQVTDRMTEVGNELGRHMNVLSHDLISLSFDGRKRRAHVGVGGGDPHYLTIRVDGDIQFTATDARVKARIDLGFQGRKVRLELPEFQMMPQSYQGDRVVVLLVPVLERRW